MLKLIRILEKQTQKFASATYSLNQLDLEWEIQLAITKDRITGELE